MTEPVTNKVLVKACLESPQRGVCPGKFDTKMLNFMKRRDVCVGACLVRCSEMSVVVQHKHTHTHTQTPC